MPSIEELKKAVNVADLLDKKELYEIGDKVVKGYQIDRDSCAQWMKTVAEAMKLAKLEPESKSFPWPNASNVVYPLVARACIDYASRTMPEIIQNERVVKVNVAGADPDGAKYRRADRTSRCTSNQLLVQWPDWEEGLDKMLQTLSVAGTTYKKTYYNPIEERSRSEFCLPDSITVNRDIQSLEQAPRITHSITLYVNDIVERQRGGLYREDVDPKSLYLTDGKNALDDDRPIDLLECHCYLDLDDDGYKEPYIVTVHEKTKEVLRIVARFEKIKRKDGKILKITPRHFFTDFHFIRSPDGGFHSVGFGSLLLHPNKIINTLFNQLVDAGTLNNTQGGFLGKGLRIKNGEIKVQMGKWQVLETASGTDIASNVYPFPVREPSPTLFQLLSLMIQVGQDLCSITDATTGKQGATNVATGTLAQLVEQGTIVFKSINKRVCRSLKREYEKIFKLNYEHLKQEEYLRILDEQGEESEADVKKDFNCDDLDIHPVADPNVSSETQRLVRAGMIQALRTADPRAADTMFLQALQLDESLIQKLLPPADPNAPPPLEQQKVMAEINEIQAKIASVSANATLEAEKNQMAFMKLQKEGQESDSRIQEAFMRSWKAMQDAQHNKDKISITATKMTSEQQLKAANMINEKELKEAELLIKAHSSKKEGINEDN